MPEMTEEQFKAEASEFLEANMSRKAEQKTFVWGLVATGVMVELDV